MNDGNGAATTWNGLCAQTACILPITWYYSQPSHFLKPDMPHTTTIDPSMLTKAAAAEASDLLPVNVIAFLLSNVEQYNMMGIEAYESYFQRYLARPLQDRDIPTNVPDADLQKAAFFFQRSIHLLAKSPEHIAVLGETYHSLGLCYTHMQCFERAFDCYSHGSVRGSLLARFNLGLCYYSGYGVTPNMSEARRYLTNVTLSSSVVLSAAWYQLGLCNQNMNPADRSEALRCFENAGSLGYTHAHVMVAHYYTIGLGTEQNLSSAYQACMEGIQAGDDVAQSYLPQIISRHNAVVQFQKSQMLPPPLNTGIKLETIDESETDKTTMQV